MNTNANFSVRLESGEMAASAFQVLSQPTKTSNKTDSSKISFAQWNIISRCSSPGDSRIGVNGEMMIPSLRRSGLIESTNSRQDELNEPNFLPCSTSRIPSRFLHAKISLIGPTFKQYRLIFLYKFKVSLIGKIFHEKVKRECQRQD